MTKRFDLAGHLLILVTLAFTVYGQLVLKWQIGMAGPMPDGAIDRIAFLLRQLLNPWVFSGFVAAFAASLAWMATMTRFDLSYAYPFMSLAFVIVMAISVLFLNEPLPVTRVLGTLCVVGGLFLITR
jgi:drug/metabolite transporter (DMT)-like permease